MLCSRISWSKLKWYSLGNFSSESSQDASIIISNRSWNKATFKKHEYLKCLFKYKDWWKMLLVLPGFSMESIPESWLLLSDESFVLKDSRSLCWLSSLKVKLQDNLLGLLLPPLDFFCPVKVMEKETWVSFLKRSGTSASTTFYKLNFRSVQLYLQQSENIFPV